VAVVHLHLITGMTVYSTAVNPLNCCVWALCKVVLQVFILNIGLVSHHLVHQVLVASCGLAEMILLGYLPAAALGHLASLLRNGPA